MKTLAIVALAALQVMLAGSLCSAKVITTTIKVDIPAYAWMSEAALLQGLKSPEAYKRSGALDEIGRRKLVRDVSAVRELLNDSDPFVRVDAAVTVFHLGDKSALPLLRKTLDDADPSLACQVMQALVAIGDAKALAFARKLSGSFDPELRTKAFEALWSSPDQNISYKAFEQALREPLYDLRLDALKALGGKDTVRAVDMLAAHLRHSRTDGEERWEAAESVVETGIWASVPVLISMVTDSDPQVAATAIKRLTEVHRLSDHLTSSNLTPDEARAAVARWQKWWNQEKQSHRPDTFIYTASSN